MAYLSEEIEPTSLGIAMGLYISGNSIGGMSGRIIIGMISDYTNWRIFWSMFGWGSVISMILVFLSLALLLSIHLNLIERSINRKMHIV